MFFYLRHKHKTIHELRKNVGLTAAELAAKLKFDTVVILKIDRLPLGGVPDDLRQKLLPILRGDNLDRIPW